MDIYELEDKIEIKSKLGIQLLIIGLLIQFAGLYYITYYIASWDTGEPIAYLIALGLDVIGRKIFES